jgi:mannose-1-phosphate guanylyltransferase
MKAMVLAAGLGTRLRPLTDNRPKALVEIAARTLLEITLSRLRAFGISEVIINVHHFADMILDYLKAHDNFGLRIEVSREEVLLDTGGGLKKAAWFFLEDSSHLDEPFLLHNVDVISTIDLRRMVQFHIGHQALATLAVQARETSRYLLFNDQLQLCGRRAGRNGKPELVRRHLAEPLRESAPLQPAETGAYCHSERSEESAFSESQAGCSTPLQALAFSGIHVISPRFFAMMMEEGVFSIIPSYLRLAAQGERILAFRADDYYWRDLGTPENVMQAAQDLKQKVLQL